jgi:hypothetical protein
MKVTDDNNNDIESIEYPLRIRAHNLICLQGYKGLGYTRDFIAHMTKIHSYLNENTTTLVKVVIGEDTFCHHCPHNYKGRCTEGDPVDQLVPTEAPDNAVLMDRRVITWLGLDDGTVYEWRQILYKIGNSVDSSAMDVLCSTVCPWRDQGHCSEALDGLNKAFIDGELS